MSDMVQQILEDARSPEDAWDHLQALIRERDEAIRVYDEQIKEAEDNHRLARIQSRWGQIQGRRNINARDRLAEVYKLRVAASEDLDADPSNSEAARQIRQLDKEYEDLVNTLS